MLYLDIEAIEILKQRNLNISDFVSNLLLQECEIKDNSNKDNDLKIINARVLSSNNELKKEVESLKKEVEKLKEKNDRESIWNNQKKQINLNNI